MTSEDVKAWAADILKSLKRYTFNSIDPKVPRKVEEVDINLIGVLREAVKDDAGNPVTDDEGEPTYTYKIVGQDARGFFEPNQPDSTSTPHALNGYFTSEENAIAASKIYFNSATVDKINELKEKKAEIEKEIEELEKELQ